MVSPPRAAKHGESTSPKEMAERAARIAAMLDRWESEDISSELDWNVEDLEPAALRHGVASDHKPQT